jgi:beta-galactosidase
VLGPVLEGFIPDADVALLYSTDTKRAYEFYPPLPTADGRPDRQAYLTIFDRFFRAAFERGAQARIVHLEQLLECDPAAFAARHPVLVVPSLYVASDAALDALVAYAEAGGHLVVGIRTGYGDELARARAEVAPARIGRAAGVRYDEYSTLDAPVPLDAEPLALSDGGEATGWADALEVDEAEVLARYAGGIYAGRAAITTRRVGAGRISYVGTLPSLAAATALLRWAAPRAVADGWASDATVTVTSGSSEAGRVWFVSNWGPDAAAATTPVALDDADASIAAGTRIVLGPWTVRVLVERPAPEDGDGTP